MEPPSAACCRQMVHGRVTQASLSWHQHPICGEAAAAAAVVVAVVAVHKCAEV